MHRICMIGTGYVGLITGVCFASLGNEVICTDTDAAKISSLINGIPPFYEPDLKEMLTEQAQCGRLRFTDDYTEAVQTSDILFFTVGTPTTNSGKMDLEFLYQAIDTVAIKITNYKILVIKSTVPAGTTRKVVAYLAEKYGLLVGIDYDIISNPEFLRQGSALGDCLRPDRVIVGSEGASEAAKRIEELYQPLTKTIIHTSFESSEMIKNTANAFLAMKISFVNNIASLCEHVGADIINVSEGVGADPRIGQSYLQAGIGYGGSCFPKDTHDLLRLAEQHGHEFGLLKSVIETNEKQPLRIIEKLSQIYETLEGRTIAVLGLSFKPNTSDIRVAPSLQIIQELLNRKARVHVWDPVAMDQVKLIFGDRLHYFTDVYSTVEQCDASVIVTEWKEIINADIDRVFRLMKHPVVIDGRNCLNYEKIKQIKGLYLSIGRPTIKNYKEDSQ